MNSMINKLESIKDRYEQIVELMTDETIISNPKELTMLAKEQSALLKPYESYNKLKKIQEDLDQAIEMLKDEELKELAKQEVDQLTKDKEELLQQLEILLIPKDPNDQYSCMIEIRGAAGGDEANIFAGDLYRMYNYYAENNNFKCELLESSESESGGFTLISFLVKGTGAYGLFKFESGSHRVQRVPKTESQGRVHTSTATVYVLADIPEEDIEIPNSELTIETHRSSGAGGQHINKTDSAVRIVHVPTGISVNCQDGRSQIQNRETALRIIRARVYQEYERQKQQQQQQARQTSIGTGDRAEKIRTYNYPQNRVTDHRIGLTINQLDRIIDGKLDDIIEALLQKQQKDLLSIN